MIILTSHPLPDLVFPPAQLVPKLGSQRGMGPTIKLFIYQTLFCSNTLVIFFKTILFLHKPIFLPLSLASFNYLIISPIRFFKKSFSGPSRHSSSSAVYFSFKERILNMMLFIIHDCICGWCHLNLKLK